MKIDEKYSIERESYGFSLVERTLIEIVENKEKTGKFKDGSKKKYYGTVYQCLNGYLSEIVNNSNSFLDIQNNVKDTIDLISSLSSKIKDEFCIEVKHC